jgi:hypothetical protein
LEIPSNPHGPREITMKIRKCYELNHNEDMAYKVLWDGLTVLKIVESIYSTRH